MKTHEQAMRGYVRCFSPFVEIRCALCPYRGMKNCREAMTQDVYNHILQLEKRLADVNASPFDGGMSQAEYLNGGGWKDATAY